MGLIESMSISGDKHSYKKFHRLIQKLQMKYGEKALLFSLKANWLDTDNAFDKINLYKRSLELAEHPLDVAVLTQSTGSITQLYIEELADYTNGHYWLGKYKECVAKHGDEYVVDVPDELEL
jgi:hypothetical protein